MGGDPGARPEPVGAGGVGGAAELPRSTGGVPRPETVIRRPLEIAYAGGWLDRAEAGRSDDAWLAEQANNPASRFLPLRNLDVGLRRVPEPDLAWIEGRDLPQAPDPARRVLLGLDRDRVAHFAFPLDDAGAERLGPRIDAFVDARSAAIQLGDRRAAVVAQARSLLDWHARHGYCAACGAPTRLQHGGGQRVCTDPGCGATHFPRTDPVVIMLVHSADDRECLLGRSTGYPGGLVSALAGFVEPAESLEEAVARELKEEAGIACDQIRYFASQPWPFPSTLMIACFARARSRRLEIDPNELELARWFSREEVRRLFDGDLEGLAAPQPIAIAYHMLKHWLDNGPD